MTEWKTYTLKELSKGRGEYGIGAPAVPFDKEKYTYLRITDINDDGTLNTSGMMSVDADDAEEYILEKNDIVFARTGNSTGRSYFYDGRDGELVYAGFLIRFRLDETKVNPKILKYYTHSKPYYDWVKSFDTGGTRGNINAKTYGDMPIYLPPRHIQDRIVGILGAIDDKIENNRRINTNLELQAQALFDKIFFDDNDVERNPLSDYADINPTRTLRQGVVARYIEMANLPTRGSFPSDWSYKSYGGGCKFANGDTIMARITPCLENGKTAYIDFLEEQEVAFGSTEYIVISAKNGYCPALFYFLARNKEFVDYAVGHMNGSSGRQRVSGADIANFQMPHITLEESNKFAEIAMPIMDVIRNNSLENRHLATLRDTLLPKLMNGEIKIDE